MFFRRRAKSDEEKFYLQVNEPRLYDVERKYYRPIISGQKLLVALVIAELPWAKKLPIAVQYKLSFEKT